MAQELNGKFPERKALAKIMDFKNYLGLGVGAIIGVGWIVVAGDWLVRGSRWEPSSVSSSENSFSSSSV